MISSVPAFLRPSLGELLLIGLVVALLFGTRRLPDLGRALGSAIRNFQRSFRGEETDAPPDAPPTNPTNHDERS